MRLRTLMIAALAIAINAGTAQESFAKQNGKGKAKGHQKQLVKKNNAVRVYQVSNPRGWSRGTINNNTRAEQERLARERAALNREREIQRQRELQWERQRQAEIAQQQAAQQQQPSDGLGGGLGDILGSVLGSGVLGNGGLGSIFQ